MEMCLLPCPMSPAVAVAGNDFEAHKRWAVGRTLHVGSLSAKLVALTTVLFRASGPKFGASLSSKPES